MIEPVSRPSRWSGFFFYLQRVNNVLFFLFLLAIAYLLVVEFSRSYSYGHEYGYGDSGFDRYNESIEGNVIETSDGQNVSYVIKQSGEDDLEIEGSNLSFTNMRSGNSRLVLPDGGDQLVLNWEELTARGSGAQAYSVLAGTAKDYEDGVLDWIVGRFSDLEQVTLAKRVSFIDAPKMIDDNIMSVIVWTTPEIAQFWLVDLRDFSIVSKTPVALPRPKNAFGDREMDEMLDSAVEAVEEALNETAR